MPPLLHVFKPLAIATLLALAALVRQPVSCCYRTLVVAGLAYCLAGDVFLMLPSDQFVLGLVGFLVGHLLYTAAFRTGASLRGTHWAWLPFLLFGAAMFAVLLPGLGAMALLVLGYIAVILTMARQAWERWRYLRQAAGRLAFSGALLFIGSDSLLALNRFRASFAAASAAVRVAYVAAQWLIARPADARLVPAQ